MSVAVTCTPTSPDAASSDCVIAVSGLAANDTAAHDVTKYPMDPEIAYYFEATASGAQTLKSHAFAPNGGAHRWMDVMFPSAGSWTVHVRKVSGDASAGNVAVTVN